MIAQDDVVHENITLVEQGMDSLMAVEVRSWFLNETEVDIPMLKIIGGSTIGDLLAEAVDRIPISIIDLSSLPNNGPADGHKQMEVQPRLVSPQSVLPQSPDVENSRASVAAASSSGSQGPGGFSPSRRSLLVQTPETEPTESSELDSPLSEVSVDDINDPAGFEMMAEALKKLVPPSSGDADMAPELETQKQDPTSTADPVPVPSDDQNSSDPTTQAENEQSLPMSYGQTGFWFLQDYLEDKTNFNMAVMFKLTGHMDVPRLERAVRVLGRRHEALRTRYFWSGEGATRVAMQGILQTESPVRLVHKRLAAQSDADDELKEMHQHVWDLDSWEAAKIHLLTVDDNTHFLLAGGHHISWDGYSFSVLFVDLEAAYSGKPLPPLGPESQYRAFPQWQRELYETGALNETLDGFRGIIDPNCAPISPFPFAKSPTRPVVDNFAQFEATATLPSRVVDKLRQLARKNRATMFHVYLAALQGLVLRLLPDTDDFFIGIADANRLDRRFIGSLGLFLNLLPLQLKRGGQGTKLGDLIQGARDAAYGALQRSNVPWSVVLDELKIPRASTHSPVFQLFVDYRQVVHERSTFGGCKLSDESWLNARTGYDLTLSITDNPKGESWLSLRLAAGMYTQESTELLMRSFVNMLETFATGIDCEAADLPAYAARDVELGLEVGKGKIESFPGLFFFALVPRCGSH